MQGDVRRYIWDSAKNPGYVAIRSAEINLLWQKRNQPPQGDRQLHLHQTQSALLGTRIMVAMGILQLTRCSLARRQGEARAQGKRLQTTPTLPGHAHISDEAAQQASDSPLRLSHIFPTEVNTHQCTNHRL